MVAVGGLHDIADLAGLQLLGGGFKLLHHVAGGEQVAVGVVCQAGVLAVLIHELVKGLCQLHRVGDGLEGSQVRLSSGLLLCSLLFGKSSAGGGVHGHEQDVLGVHQVLILDILGQFLLRRGVLAALPEQAIQHVAVENAHGAHLLHVLFGEAVFLQEELIGLGAAHLLLGLGHLLLIVRLVLFGHGVALFLGVGLDDVIEHRCFLGLLLHILVHGHIVAHGGGPVDLRGAAHLGVGGHRVRVLGHPEEELAGGHVVAVDGEHNGGPAVAHDLFHRVIAAAAAEQADGHHQGQGSTQDSAHAFLHESFSF